MAVFLSHAGSGPWTGQLLWMLRPLGSDAVTVFFVLSGYVIAYAATQRETNPRAYAAARLARLHSGAVPAILLTLAADRIGAALRPDLYATFTELHLEWQPWQAFNALLFTHQVWWNNLQIGSNIAYWSLGYEAPYYVAFGVALFAPRRWAIAGAIAVLVLAGPNVAKLAPMWLMGAGVYAWTAYRPLSRRTGLLVWLVSLLWLAAALLPVRPRVMLFYPMQDTVQYGRDMLHYYAVATAFGVNIAGFHAAAPLFGPLLDRVARPIRWLGARTFALYIFHLPLIPLVVTLAPWPPTTWPTRLLVLVGVPMLIIPLAELSERRKDDWRRLYDRVLRSPPRATPSPDLVQGPRTS